VTLEAVAPAFGDGNGRSWSIRLIDELVGTRDLLEHRRRRLRELAVGYGRYEAGAAGTTEPY
jgi:hypothetical protein